MRIFVHKHPLAIMEAFRSACWHSHCRTDHDSVSLYSSHCVTYDCAGDVCNTVSA